MDASSFYARRAITHKLKPGITSHGKYSEDPWQRFPMLLQLCFRHFGELVKVRRTETPLLESYEPLYKTGYDVSA